MSTKKILSCLPIILVGLGIFFQGALFSSAVFPVAFAADTVRPSVPAGLKANVISSSQVNLTWTASTDNVGVAGYKIFRCQGSCIPSVQIGTSDTNSYSDTNLSPLTWYAYSVSAYDAAGNESLYKSRYISVRTYKFSVGDRIKTRSLVNVRSTSSTSGTILGTQAVGALGTVIGGPFYTYISSYRWWNINYDTGPDGWSSETYLQKVVTTDTTPPTVSITSPTSGTTYTSVQTVTIAASATDNVGVSKVEFYDGSTLMSADTVAPYSYAWPITSASNGAHSWTAKAYDAANNSSISSVISLTVDIAAVDTTPPTVPTNLSATAVSSSQINLTWGASTDTGGSGLKGYNIYRNDIKITAAPIAATSYSDSGLTASTTYLYAVSAVDNANNESAKSAQASATTLIVAFDFSLSNSGNVSITQGSSGTSTITVNLLSGAAQAVSFSASGLPAGTSVSFSPTSCNPTCSSILTITTLTSTPVGISTISITGAASALTKTTSFNLTVNPIPSTKFQINDRIQVSSGPLNVRSTPSVSGTLLGTQATGALGAVIGGPTYADSYWWWNINFDTGADGWSVEDYLQKFTPDTTPPTVPTNLNGSATSPTQTSLTWTGSTDPVVTGQITSGLKGYNVYRGGVKITATPVTTTSFADSGLIANTTYTYTVSSVDNSNNESAQSASKSITTLLNSDTTPPTVPTSPTATAVSSSQINLTWTASTDPVVTGQITSGLAGYKIYRGGTQIATAVTASYSDSGLLAGTPYCYTIAAYDNAGNTSAQSSQVCATTQSNSDTTPPTVPTNLLATAISSSQINLSWSASTDTGGSGLRGYNIYRNDIKITSSPITEATFLDTNLAVATNYSYQISAVDNAGNESLKTSPVSVTTLTLRLHACDYYNEANGDSFYKLAPLSTAPGYFLELFQKTISTGEPIVSAKFYVQKIGNPTGRLQARIHYPFPPENQIVASSQLLDVSSLSSSPQLITFTFTPSAIISASSPISVGLYALSDNLAWDQNNYIAVLYDGSSPTHPGTLWRDDLYLQGPTWGLNEEPSKDLIFYLFCDKDNITPSVPAGLTATAFSSSQINLSWNPSTDSGGSGLRGYKVYRNGSQINFVLAPNTSISDTGLTASTLYAYNVSAVDNIGNESAKSVQASTTTLPDSTSAEWSRSFGGPGDDRGWSVAMDSSGNVVMTGWFSGTVDLGGGPLTTNHLPWMDPNQLQDIFLAKYSSSGAHLWSKQLGSESNDYGYGVAVDGNGDVVVTGACGGYVDFGNGVLTGTQGGYDIFVAKYSGADGSYLWAKRFGGIYDDYGYSVAVDSSGNVIVAGLFRGTIDFGGGPVTAKGTYDAFIAKFSASGAHVWSKSFGSVGSSSYAYGVAVDTTGNAFVVGRFTGAVNFGGGLLASAGGMDIFLAKYSGANGSHLWSQHFGHANSDCSLSIAVDGNGNVIMTGSFSGGVDFGGGLLNSSGSTDIFIAKYSGANGSHLWSQRFGNTGDDSGNGIAVDSSGNIIVTGSFNGAVDFGGGSLASGGGSDIFVAKFSSSGSHIWSERFGFSLEQYGYAVAVKGNSNIAVTGFFQNIVDFGGGRLTSAGIWDIFLVKLVKPAS